MVGERVTLGHEQGAGEEHEVAVAAGLHQGGEQVGLPAHGALALRPVAQEVGEDGVVVGHVQTQLQGDGLAAAYTHIHTHKEIKLLLILTNFTETT